MEQSPAQEAAQILVEKMRREWAATQQAVWASVAVNTQGDRRRTGDGGWACVWSLVTCTLSSQITGRTKGREEDGVFSPAFLSNNDSPPAG